MTFETVPGCASWVCYFINGDADSLSDAERAHADRWLERNRVRVLSLALDADTGQDSAPYFSWGYGVHCPDSGASGGDLLDYLCEVLPD